MGKFSTARSMFARFQDPGVMVVAFVPSAGPVPPPIMVVIPEFRAVANWSGLMKWMWVSRPPAVRMRPSPATASVADRSPRPRRP